MTFKLWEHPNTGEQRVYLNDREYFTYGQKAYFTQKGMVEGSCQLICFSDGVNSDTLEELTHNHLEENFGSIDFIKWGQVLELCE